MNEKTNITKFIVNTVLGTPWWVWIVFVYLLFIGIKALKQRAVYLPKLFIIPIIFSAIKYKIFLNANLQIWVAYSANLAIAILIGYAVAAHEQIKIIKQNTSIEIPGNMQTLIILMCFFCIKYVFGYLHATEPYLSKQFFVWEISISGLLSGYFLGKTLSYLRRFIIET